jgi:hypothetical protein
VSDNIVSIRTQLPNEIWATICEKSDFASSKQLRLVNKAFSSFASKKTFEEVYVTALPDSFAKLQNISAHPIFRNHVNRLVYLIDRLDKECVDLNIWKKRALHVSTNKISPENKSKYLRLRQLYSQQRKLLRDGIEKEVLKECVALLPNLTDVETTTSVGIQCDFEDGPLPILGSLFMETLVDPDMLLSGGSIIERKYANPVASLIVAFRKSRKSMRRLELDQIPWEFWEYGERPPLFDSIEPSISIAFSNLRSMTLRAWMGTMGKYTPGEKTPISRLITFLSGAPLLETLQVNLEQLNETDEEFMDEEDTDLTDAFEHLAWPNLHTLQFSNCKTDRDSFIRFMESHAKSLKTLRLQWIELREKAPVTATAQLPEEETAAAPESENYTKPIHLTAPAGASWEYAIKYLAPLMIELQSVELVALDDFDLQLKSGGPLQYGTKLKDEEYVNRRLYCADLSGYLLANGDDEFPIYGDSDRCVQCGRYHDYFDEDSEMSDEGLDVSENVQEGFEEADDFEGLDESAAGSQEFDYMDGDNDARAEED